MLELPAYLDKIHNVFHESLLRKVKIDPSRVLPHVPMKIKGDLTMEAKSVKILDRDVRLLRNKRFFLGGSIMEKLSNRKRNRGKRI